MSLAFNRDLLLLLNLSNLNVARDTVLLGAVIGGVVGNLAGGKTIKTIDDQLNQSRSNANKLTTEQESNESSKSAIQ